MTLTFKDDLVRVKVNHNAKYLCQRAFNSQVIVQMHRHTPDWLLYLDHQSG